MINRLRRPLSSLLVLLLPCGSAGSSNDEIREAINRTCVPLAEMALAGVRLGDSRTRIEDGLGTPDTRADEEPDAVLQYPGLRVRLHASRAQSILATSPRWSTPSGIQVGASPAQAGEILGFDLDSVEPPHSRSPRGYSIHRCIGSPEQMDVEHYLRLELSPDGSIAEVHLFWVAP